MSITLVWISAALLGIFMLHSATAQSLTCAEPFQAAFMQVTNDTFPATASSLDSNLVFFREILRFTEDEIDREREAAISYFNQRFGLDFSNVDPNELGQRVLGNATFQPVLFPYNGTMVYNRWLVRGPSTSRCFRFTDGGFSAAFNGTVILRGEYGGEEGIMASSGDSLLYGRDILYDSCNQQPIIFQTESLTPIRRVPGDGWLVVSLRIRNRQLGEGTTWGLTRITLVNPTTLLYESRQVYTFL